MRELPEVPARLCCLEPVPNEAVQGVLGALDDLRGWAGAAPETKAAVGTEGQREGHGPADKQQESAGTVPEAPTQTGPAALAAAQQPQGTGPAEAGGDYCHVTLTQAAAIVNRSKRTLEGYKQKDPEFPAPRVKGGDGKPDEWAWSELRPWLAETFKKDLPERFPTDRFQRS